MSFIFVRSEPTHAGSLARFMFGHSSEEGFSVQVSRLSYCRAKATRSNSKQVCVMRPWFGHGRRVTMAAGMLRPVILQGKGHLSRKQP